jgi:hypothetical protein
MPKRGIIQQFGSDAVINQPMQQAGSPMKRGAGFFIVGLGYQEQNIFNLLG